MDDKEKKESKVEETMTEEQLKEVIKGAIEGSDLSKDMEAIKTDLVDLKKVEKTVENDCNATKKFVTNLFTDNKAELKTITTDDASMGYSVPTELAKAIHEAKDKISKIRTRAFTFRMAGKFDLPIEGTACTAYWVTTEADTNITESAPTLGKRSLDDYYLAVRVRVPYKLISTSGVNIQSYIASLSARTIVSTEETAFVGGSGSDEPTGFREASVDSIAQDGDDLAYDDVIDLIFSLEEQYRNGSVIMTSTLGIKALLKIKDDQGIPIFKYGGKLFDKYEVVEVTDIPENLGTSANTTEMWIADLKEYWIKDGEGMMSEIRKVEGRLQVDMYLYEATDGVVVNTDGFKKMTGVK